MKIIIWGTGRYAQELLNNGLNATIMGFLETEKQREEFRGYPVYDIHSIPEDYDYIFVANAFSGEIYKTCLEHSMDLKKIVFLKRGRNDEFNPDIQIKEILGENNYAKYASGFGIWKNTFFEEDMAAYSAMNTRPEFAIDNNTLYPIITEKYTMNSGMSEYFWQDLWAAKQIIAGGIKEHWDIGSRVDGFIAHLLAAGIKVNMIDVRPFPGTAENLHTIVDDATMMRNFEDDSITSLSALCSLEHFGLGRFGDPVDPEACFTCFSQIQKKLKKGGKLWISLPVGQDRVEFNAHRIFYADTIVKCFAELKLVEYSVIIDRKIQYDAYLHAYDDWSDNYVIGMFCFEK